MKKNTCAPLILVLSMILMFPTHSFAKTSPDLFINGNSKSVQTILKDSSTLVPLRFCSEELQASVNWNKNTQEIIVSKGPNTILFEIGQKTYYVNGEKESLLAPLELINGVTYLPFRPIVEALDGIVLYNNEHKFINIYDSNSEAYKVYLSLNSNDIIERRFAMLESPKLNFQASYGGSHGNEYIFPRGKVSNYFFRKFSDEGTLYGIDYFEIHDGVAIQKWSQTQNSSTPITSGKSPILNYIGDGKNTTEVGIFPSLIDTSFIGFYNNLNESSKDLITQSTTIENTVIFIDKQGFSRPNITTDNHIVFSPFGSMYYLVVFEE